MNNNDFYYCRKKLDVEFLAIFKRSNLKKIDLTFFHEWGNNSSDPKYNVEFTDEVLTSCFSKNKKLESLTISGYQKNGYFLNALPHDTIKELVFDDVKLHNFYKDFNNVSTKLNIYFFQIFYFTTHYYTTYYYNFININQQVAQKFSNLQHFSILSTHYDSENDNKDLRFRFPKSLITLNLKRTNTTDFSFLSTLTALKSLTLYEEYVSDKTLFGIADNCLGLEFLDLSSCKYVIEPTMYSQIRILPISQIDVTNHDRNCCK